MKVEKQSQERNFRTLQNKRNTGGDAQFIDNRSSSVLQAVAEKPLQRQADEEETLQGKFVNVTQRQADEDETLQGKFENVAQRQADEEETLQGKFENVAQRALDEEEPLQQKPNNTGMPDSLKSGVESLSGYSMDNVRVHYNSSKPAAVQAHAYTQGENIHIAPGQEQHLPHEAWHVTQQMAGRVAPTTEIGGLPVNDNVALEREADVMGERARNF